MIKYCEDDKVFKIDTLSTTYMIAVAEEKYVGHLYYGKKINDTSITDALRTNMAPFAFIGNDREKISFMDSFPMEYPSHGVGDFRGDAICVRTVSGYRTSEFLYDGYEIVNEKPVLKGLPSTFASENGGSSTLKLYLKDSHIGVKITLLYTVFEDSDAIARSVTVSNEGSECVFLERVLSASFDMDNDNYELLTLNGAWGRERKITKNPINFGYQGVSSYRGVSGHQHHPFIGILSKGANDEYGDVYGVHFVYSGNFKGEVYRGAFDSVRIMMGINDEDFEWKLEKGDEFVTPEAILVYSGEGIGKMSRTYHDLYRNHLIRSPYKDKKRPILINNWEATYFDFDTDKLLSIAREASQLGIEMFVMDDGWFGKRNDDNTSLGDWIVNPEKIKGGLKYLVDEVNKLGMKFGIWFEPEMVSPDSNLYRKHPDWAIAVPGRKGGLSRNQYVLDITREEVRQYLKDSIISILSEANIEYVKWDMNRPLSDLGSLALPSDRQGELCHRYTLALYDLQESILQRFPNLLLENCSSGGARFDPGMLYYSPQIWCSDDTDAIERLMIQEGTALLYPLSSIGAHVSDCPNHEVGRVTPFETRGYVALAGTFGYELDVTRISEEDKSMIPNQCKMYHKYRDILSFGDYYRLSSEENRFDAYMVTSKDRTEAIITYVQILNRPNTKSIRLKLKGLDDDKRYGLYRFNISTGEEELLSESAQEGRTLKNAGIMIPGQSKDFESLLIHLKEV